MALAWQVLDSDALIQQEREKLRIQQQWEAKLRQAEIDLSMERAKLARERSELDKQSAQPPLPAASGASDKQMRRWREYLGLKEESSE